MLDGKTALVTGAGRGIGRGIALALAAAGAKVLVNDLGASLAGDGAEQGPAAQVAAEITKAGGVALSNFGSVADFGQATAMVEQAVKAWGRLDILVNVAGILRDRMLFNMTEAEWDAVIAVHLKGTFNTTRAASVGMREQRGGATQYRAVNSCLMMLPQLDGCDVVTVEGLARPGGALADRELPVDPRADRRRRQRQRRPDRRVRRQR